jgi:hypothetical protein
MTMTTARAGRDRGPGRPPRGGGTALVVLVAAGLAVLALLGTSVAAVPARAATPGDTWIAELAVEGGDDTNVVAAAGAVRLAGAAVRAQSARSSLAEGELLLAPRRMPDAVDRVSAAVTADVPPGAQVVVDVRGLRSDGTWSGWVTAGPGGPAVLPEATTQVQVRATLVAAPGGAGPALQRLWLSADRTRAAAAPAPQAAPAVGSRVFATREGLVGGTTANGHVIVPRDHFVALPSRRGLSPRDTGDYTVKVCAPTGRCAWSPVWDVGPWNTTDDHWNPAATRQSWKDLPQGTPEAQAAYQQRYNGGKDGFGRTVANPAGIDLADGTFYDDLGLRDNAWVTVTYLWTATGPTGLATPTGAPTLVVRSAPTDASSAVGAVARGARVAVQCTTAGEQRSGAQGTSSWLRLGPDQYVPAAGVEAPRVASC